MIDIEQVIKEVADRTKIDKDLVNTVCKYVFVCIVNTMKDETDTSDILLNKFIKFKLKPRYKEEKQRKYSSK